MLHSPLRAAAQSSGRSPRVAKAPLAAADPAQSRARVHQTTMLALRSRAGRTSRYLFCTTAARDSTHTGFFPRTSCVISRTHGVLSSSSSSLSPADGLAPDVDASTSIAFLSQR